MHELQPVLPEDVLAAGQICPQCAKYTRYPRHTPWLPDRFHHPGNLCRGSSAALFLLSFVKMVSWVLLRIERVQAGSDVGADGGLHAEGV